MSLHAEAGYIRWRQRQAISKAGKKRKSKANKAKPARRLAILRRATGLWPACPASCASSVLLAIHSPAGDRDASLPTQTWFPRVFGLSVAGNCTDGSREIATDRVRFGNGGEHCRRAGAESSFVPCRSAGPETVPDGPHLTSSHGLFRSLPAWPPIRGHAINKDIPFHSKGQKEKKAKDTIESSPPRMYCICMHACCALPIHLLIVLIFKRLCVHVAH